MRTALLDYGVVFFRNQRISEPDQVRFTSLFWTAGRTRAQTARAPRARDFLSSPMSGERGAHWSPGHGEVSFHSDLSYLRQPGTLSVLYAVEIPQEGGQTQWCNCTAACADLDSNIKRRIRDLRAVHRHYVEEQNPPEMIDHPVVRTHPETGRKSLYVGPHLTKHIVGMKSEEER